MRNIRIFFGGGGDFFAYICEANQTKREMGLKVFTVSFANAIDTFEIPQFRGAVIAAVGREGQLLFHDHVGESGYRYAYPLIQYKRIDGRASIVGIGDGIDALGALLSDEPRVLRLASGRIMSLAVEGVTTQDCLFAVGDSADKAFRLRRWLPFNSDNYRRYRQTQSLVDRVSMLEKIVVGNILSMARGLDLFVDVQIDVRIMSVRQRQGLVSYKNTQMMAFDVDFLTNLDLPVDIGLGKGASIGFGVVEKIDK